MPWEQRRDPTIRLIDQSREYGRPWRDHSNELRREDAGMRISPRTKPFLMVLALLAGVMALTWQNPAPAAACSCAVPTATDWAEMVDAVAEGTVAEAHVPDIGSGEDAVYQFIPTKGWKGDITGPIEFRSANNTASCGIEPVKAGATILLSAHRGEDGWTTSLCSGPPAELTDLDSLFGEPTTIVAPAHTSSAPSPTATTLTDPSPAGAGDSGSNTLLMPTLVGGVALLGVVAILVIRRSRRTP